MESILLLLGDAPTGSPPLRTPSSPSHAVTTPGQPAQPRVHPHHTHPAPDVPVGGGDSWQRGGDTHEPVRGGKLLCTTPLLPSTKALGGLW